MLLILYAIAAIFLLIAIFGRKGRPEDPYDNRGFDHNHIHKNGTKFDDYGFDYWGYDAEGYCEKGYDRNGKNRKGQYNRIYDTYSAQDGLNDVRFYPISITPHAQMRMRERLGITDYQEMNELVFDAYRFGKSKRQIRKSSAFLVEECERNHDGNIILIYHNIVFVFSKDNSVVSLFPNDKFPL